MACTDTNAHAHTQLSEHADDMAQQCLRAAMTGTDVDIWLSDDMTAEACHSFADSSH